MPQGLILIFRYYFHVQGLESLSASRRFCMLLLPREAVQITSSIPICCTHAHIHASGPKETARVEARRNTVIIIARKEQNAIGELSDPVLLSLERGAHARARIQTALSRPHAHAPVYPMIRFRCVMSAQE